jgi:hypothetical protein
MQVMAGKWWITDRDKIIYEALITNDFGKTYNVFSNSMCVHAKLPTPSSPAVCIFHANSSKDTLEFIPCISTLC